MTQATLILIFVQLLPPFIISSSELVPLLHLTSSEVSEVSLEYKDLFETNLKKLFLIFCYVILWIWTLLFIYFLPLYKIVNIHGDNIGIVTSGTQSPTLSIGIGLGYISKSYSKIGTKIGILIREKNCPAHVVKLPFLKT